MAKYAAIDLGTNTFHILIASIDPEGRLVDHYRQREYIHLAKDGISRISDEAFDKALNCIIMFSQALSKFKLEGVSVSGTAALRTASNGPALVKRIEDILGYKVNVIDGLTEARLIYEGVSLALPSLREGNHLIMDIGGGSVEFIVIKEGHFFYSNSYPIGIAVLKKVYHLTEPIARDEIIIINQFIRDNIAKLLYTCRGMIFTSLIGASGSFEVLSQMAKLKENGLVGEVSVSQFEEIYEGIIGLNLEERLERKDIPDDRAALIVVAFQLIHFILTQIKCEKIVVSPYAMKEGMIINLAYPKN